MLTEARRWLAVPGAGVGRWATHAVAAAGIVSLLAGLWLDPIVAALFALVLLGLTAQRLLQLPGAFQACTGAALLAAAWAAVLGWYAVVPWLDLAVHAAATGLLAVIAVVLMTRTGVLPSWAPGARVGPVVVTVAVGTALAVAWELGEWYGHSQVDPAIMVGYEDTMGDLASGAAGSMLAGLVLGRRGLPGSPPPGEPAELVAHAVPGRAP